MNRLLRVGLDTLFTSVTPILGWFLLGILVDKNLINIFTLVYPMQFIIIAIQSVFGTGANTSSIRDNNKSAVFSGIVSGSCLGALILGIVLYPSYKVDIMASIIVTGTELATMYVYPIYLIKLTYIQIECSAITATAHKQIANLFRIACSILILSPYCNSIGLAVSAIYQYISTKFVIDKNKITMEMIENKVIKNE